MCKKNYNLGKQKHLAKLAHVVYKVKQRSTETSFGWNRFWQNKINVLPDIPLLISKVKQLYQQ